MEVSVRIRNKVVVVRACLQEMNVGVCVYGNKTDIVREVEHA